MMPPKALFHHTSSPGMESSSHSSLPLVTTRVSNGVETKETNMGVVLSLQSLLYSIFCIVSPQTEVCSNSTTYSNSTGTASSNFTHNLTQITPAANESRRVSTLGIATSEIPAPVIHGETPAQHPAEENNVAQYQRNASKGKSSTRLPRFCRCRKSNAPRSVCYYRTKISRRNCRARYCGAKYMCVNGGKRRGTTLCIRRRATRLTVKNPRRIGRCVTIRINRTFYVPYHRDLRRV